MTWIVINVTSALENKHGGENYHSLWSMQCNVGSFQSKDFSMQSAFVYHPEQKVQQF